jgi:iron complex outermembrane receptor protein
LYFEGGVDISESWRFEAGARYNVERKELDYLLQRTGLTKTAQEDEVWDSPTGTIRLNYLPTEDATFYAKYTRGWKSGNFNATGNLIRGVTLANPEEVTAYEVGLNISLFEARLQFVGALFFYDYDNYQIFTSDNNLGSNPEFVTINANSAENYGAELEVDIAPWEGADVEVSFGWLESQFLDFTQEQLQQGAIGNQGFLSVTELNYSGNRLLNSPEFTVSIIASQEIDLDRFGILTLRYSGAWTDNVYFDASEGRGIPNDDEISILPPDTIGQTAYWLHGAGVDWRPQLGHLRLSGWIRNIADKSYKTFSFDANTFQGTTIHFVGEPRTYGVTFGVEF